MNKVVGSVNTNGGPFINGNENIIVNVIDGLSVLLSDYHGQLTSINSLINDFKPKTALELLEDLEKRVTLSAVPKEKKIESKILFLKALCKRELSVYTKEESAKDFIKAYRLNSDDTQLKIRACIEFLNIDDSTNAEKLADQILEYDDYNVTAWFVKSIISDNLKLFLKDVPKAVLNDYNFQHSLIYQIIGKHKIKSFSELAEYSLELRFDFEKYKLLTADNKQAWIIALDLLISKVLTFSALKYLLPHNNLVLQSDKDIENLVKLLDQFVDTLHATEISESIKHQKFYQNYLKSLLTNNEEFGKSLDLIYEQIEKPYWFYTQFYCHYLNRNKDFKNMLASLIDYENLNGELHSEFYLLKTIPLYKLRKSDDLKKLLNDYLDSIDIVDEGKMLTLLIMCSLVSEFVSDEYFFEDKISKILKKNFFSNELKLLTHYSLKLKFSNNYDQEEVFQSLNEIKNNNGLTANCKNLIAENFDRLGKSAEALIFMNTYVDKNVVSESLRLYIIILRNQLRSKQNSLKGDGVELLGLLHFWRKSSDAIDEELLCLEHQLRALIDDFSALIEIDYLLYINFPDNYTYLYFYLACLEMTHNKIEIINISKQIPSVYENENTGISIAGVLLRNKNNLEKGFEILFNLAKNKDNTQARMNYFGMAITGGALFESYKVVKIGNWVVYDVDGRKEKLKIVKSQGIQKDLINKSVGEKFTQKHPLTGKVSTIEVLEIFNEYLNLFREIEEEAKSPVNELGFYSFQLPSDLNDFPKFLMEQFGSSGSDKKLDVNQRMDEYSNFKIGYTFLVSAVFKNNFVDGYNFLTKANDTRFITIPNSLTTNIDMQNESLRFILDLSSLLLFYSLSNELNFNYYHQYLISFNTRHQIEAYLNLELNSPQSTLTMDVTLEGVENFFHPEDSHDKRVALYQSILEWIDCNCEIDLVEEKLDTVLKLSHSDEKRYEGTILKPVIDSLYLGTRENCRMISSELFIFKSEIITNFLNPEKYLLTYYPEKCDEDFYRYLLKSNYLGINISFEVLRREFVDYIGGRENYFFKAVENLPFFINSDPQVILTCVKFFDFLNNSPLPVFSIKKFIGDIFNKSIHGMSAELRKDYMDFVKTHMKFKFI